MSLNQLLPFVSTAVMLVFTIYVLQRYSVRRAPHFLFWGIGLAMFGAGSFAEAYLARGRIRRRAGDATGAEQDLAKARDLEPGLIVRD